MIYTVRHLLENKKMRNNVIFIFLLTVSLTLLASCGEKQDENDLHYIFQVENVVNNLGKDKEVILSEFNISEEGEELVELTEDFIYNDASVKVEFEFLNDKMFRVRYNFGTETDAAFVFIDELMSTFKEKYGQSDPYNTLPDRIEGLTLESYLKDDIPQYKEYWIDSGVTFEGMVPEEYQDTRRIDLGIGIYRFPMEEVETVIYVGGIVNPTGTGGLEK